MTQIAVCSQVNTKHIYTVWAYPQKLALTSPTGGGHSVGIVRSRTKATEFSEYQTHWMCKNIYSSSNPTRPNHTRHDPNKTHLARSDQTWREPTKPYTTIPDPPLQLRNFVVSSSRNFNLLISLAWKFGSSIFSSFSRYEIWFRGLVSLRSIKIFILPFQTWNGDLF